MNPDPDFSLAVLCIAAAFGGVFVVVVQSVLNWSNERAERQRSRRQSRMDRAIGGGW